MDINHILLLVAVLNLSADLYNVMRYRAQLPRGIMTGTALALSACVAGWVIAPTIAGYVGLGVLLIYIAGIKTYTRKRAPDASPPSPATKFLIALNVAVFIVQISRAATNDVIGLIDLGAAFTPLLEAGELWRIMTAQFLHFGVLHLAFNMFGLWILGRPVEAMIGAARFVALYLLCGTGGMVLAWKLSLFGDSSHPIILLGASASVMGFVGTQAAIALLAYRHTGSIAAKAQLGSMIQIVSLQAIFDMMVPEVSSTAHIGGAAVGFCVTYVVFDLTLRRRRALQM
jgi:rhomboid protease GluP